MNESQTKAWDCLTPVEQQSLYLQLAQGKSSWEAGEILKITHYKYLEIKERAQKFFKMLSNFYDSYSDIFRPDGPAEEVFKDYIYGCIEKRMSTRQALRFTGDSSQLLPDVSQRCIIRNMKYLHESEHQWDKQTWALIQEFDRWNNFRVLPKILHQPSAFKRRLNKKHKIYIRYTLNKIPTYLHKAIKEKYFYKVKPSKLKYYVVLVSEELYPDLGYLVMPVRPLQEVIDEMSKLYIYVFKEKADAEDFGFLISRYRAKTANVRLGQNFWPEYLSTIQKAVNYGPVNNIDISIQKMDMAYEESFSSSRKRKSTTQTNCPSLL